MGRFFQTSNSPFVDYIFQPNLNVHLALAKKEIENNYLKSRLLQDAPDITIPHLNFNAENARVKSLQNKYETEAINLTQKIYNDVDNAPKYITELKQLQKEILQDKTSGDWYNVEQRYNDYNNWLKDNKKIKDSNPTLFNQLHNYYLNDVINRGTSDPQTRFLGQKIIEKPDLINDYRKLFEDIKANASETSDGKYKIKNEWVTEDEVANIAWNTLVSDKNYIGYVNQMGDILGQKGYLDENGNPITPYNFVNENGKIISYDEYNKLSSDEKKKVKKQLNPNNAFYSDLATVAQTFGFQKQSIDENKFALANKRHTDTLEEINIRNQNAKMLELLRQRGSSNKLLLRYNLENEKTRNKFKNDLYKKYLNGDDDASHVLDIINAKETVGTLTNPSASLDTDYNSVENNRGKSFVISLDDELGERYINIDPGSIEYAAQQRIKNASKYASNKLGDNKIVLNNGDTFKAEEYFRWLGNRRHTEETGNKFLEKKKFDYSKNPVIGGQQYTIAQNVANNTRFLPGFLKTDIGKDRDKIYEIGNKYEKERDKWYDDYNQNDQQLNLQPINDIDITKNIVSEIKNNPENFNLIDEHGEIPKKFLNILSEITDNNLIYFTAANARNELGMRTKINGKDYFIFPNTGNTAEINLMRNLSLIGVDPNSQYFKEMSDRIANTISYELKSVGKNSKGNRSIVRDIHGIKWSIEQVDKQIHLRTPDKGLNTPADKVFSDVYQFVKILYQSQK